MASENNLNAVFTDIANAIRDKKGSVNTIKPINMADEILTIETKSTIYKTLEARGTNWSNAFYVNSSYPNLFYYMTEIKESDLPPSNNVVDMESMFSGCKSLTSIPLLDTSSCTTMSGMFDGCSSLTTIPLLDTSKATDLSYMFRGCSNITTIPQIDTSNCTTMNNMFSLCSKLISIPQLNTSKSKNFLSMFNGCNALTTIPLLDTSGIVSNSDMSYMFQKCYVLEKIDVTKLVSGTSYNNNFAKSCYSLKTLIIRTMDTIPNIGSSAFTDCYHFYGTTDATYNPNGLKDGRIYVPDDKVESLKTATNWSVFADIIKPLSEYTGE